MLQGQLIAVKALSPQDLAAMHALLDRHFRGVQPAIFWADLQAKNWCILIRDPSGSLVGFSTLLLYQTHYQNQPVQVLYSGDTIMDPSGWSSSTLARTWITAVRQLRQAPDCPLYWLLITSGYRTYRFLPTFWQAFYPCYDRPTPDSVQALMDFLARERFGSAYNAHSGIVQLPHPQVLRDKLLEIPPQRSADPHVQFFAQRNPGFIQGDELVCLTEITPTNLTGAGQRLWAAVERATVSEPLQ